MQLPRRIFLAVFTFSAALAGATGSASGPVLESVGITVSDLDRSVAFFTDVLTFRKVSEVELSGAEYEHAEGLFGLRMRVAKLQLGSEFIELTEYLAPKGRPLPADARSNDRSFQHIAIIVSDVDRGYRWLREHKVQHASSGPQLLPNWNPSAGGIQAFYFRDPDGHALEILAFPPGKGDPKWHQSTDKLFLGIDHTAIVVANTSASIEFYRAVAGLHVAGESENYGVEQEHLNNVFGARLRITALRGVSGPGVELLEYLAPRDGRPYPEDEHSNDIVHWQSRFSGLSVNQATQEARKSGAALVSPGEVETPGAEAGYRKSVLFRDPDGHAVQFVER